MRWCTVTPLLHGKLDYPFTWGENTRLDSLPEWLFEKDVAGNLSKWQRNRLDNCQLALIEEYQASSLGDPDPSWEGAPARSKQDCAQERMQFVILAIWLAKPSPLTFEIVVHAHAPDDSGRWLVNQLLQIPRTYPDPGEEDADVTREDLEESSALFDAIVRLPRDSAVWTALFTVWRALQENRQAEYRILLFWVALEAIFGPQDAREIRHRISERMALFLASPGEEAKKVYREAKRGYDLRSKIAHGFNVRDLDPNKAVIQMRQAADWLRDSLRKILRDEDLMNVLNSKSREDFLDELALG